MAILQRIRAALDPRVKIEDLMGEDAFTPLKDFGEALGAGYGIETPRGRERREQAQARHEMQLGVIDGALGSQLDGLLGMDPENAEHRSMVKQLADRSIIVGTMLRSQYPEMQEAGREELASIMQDIRGSGLAVEQRRVQDAALEAAGVKEDWDNFGGLYDDLYRESGDFLEIGGSYGALRASYAGGIEEAGNANDIAAVNSLQRMIDPGVSVREGDVSLLANLAGIPDALVTAANRVVNDGARFTPAQREELLRLGNDLMAAANAKQQGINGRFQSQGEAAGLGSRLLQELRIPIIDTGEVPAAPAREDVSPQEAAQAAGAAGEEAGRLAQRAGNSMRDYVGGFFRGSGIADAVLGRPVDPDEDLSWIDRVLGRPIDRTVTAEEAIEQERETFERERARGPRRGIILRPTN